MVVVGSNFIFYPSAGSKIDRFVETVDPFDPAAGSKI